MDAVAGSPARAPAGARPIRPLLRRFTDLLLPPVCIACRTRIGSHGLLWACFAKIDFIAPPICARLGVPLPFDAGQDALSAAAIAAPPVYDRARRGALFGHHARANPEPQISRSAGEAPAVRPLARQSRRRASRRCGAHRARAALPVAAVVAAVQPVGHAGDRSRAPQRHPGRLLRAEAGAADVESGGAFGRPAAAQRRRRLQGRQMQDRAYQGQARGGGQRCDYHRSDCRRLRPRALNRAKAARVHLLALARAVEPAAFVL
jgi:hypothetical protein